MKKFGTTVRFSLLGLALSGCSQLSSSMQPVSFNGKSQSSGGEVLSVAANMACLTNKVDYVLSTAVLDFEMEGGGALTAGFSPTLAVLANINANVTYSTGQLQTSMSVSDPLKPGVTITTAQGEASNNNLSFAVNASISLATFGPSFWYSTPISTLSSNTLQNNLGNLSTALATSAPGSWWTTVSQLQGANGFFIPVGTEAGVQVGDKFAVMDATYVWGGNGQPCINELLLPVINSNTPKVVATVQSVDVDYAYLTYTAGSAAEPIALYDYVQISKLTPSTAPVAACTNFLGIGCPSTPASTARTTLSRSIRIGSVSAPALNFMGQNNVVTTIDISPFVQSQLQTMLSTQGLGGFYLHQ